MTSWLPDLSGGPGPLYLRLANRAEADIGEGLLPPGTKLPPQRNLAFDIGVTIGTVGRAYALLRERGLVSGEVGRGTFVSGGEEVRPEQAPPQLRAETRASSPGSDKLAMDSTAAPDVGQAGAIGELTREIVRRHPDEILSYVRVPEPAWLEAGSSWLATGDWRPAEDSIVPTLGAHAAVLAVIAAVTAPGDKIVFEELTYSSIARSANLIGRRSVTVELDEDGVDPEDFERLCAQQHPKLAFLMPALHNPTLTIMPEERRREIVGDRPQVQCLADRGRHLRRPARRRSRSLSPSSRPSAPFMSAACRRRWPPASAAAGSPARRISHRACSRRTRC